MGRGSRQSLAERINRDEKRDGLVPSRILAPSLLSGAPQKSFYTEAILLGSEITESPSDVPIGPAYLDEDGEENPEATLLADMSLGQIGKDERGFEFQLLRGSGETPPKRVLIRSLVTEEVFWQDTALEQTVRSETVSYDKIENDFLLTLGGNPETIVRRMKEEGLFDMQVRDGQGVHTLIGNWLLGEENGSFKAMRCTQPRLAKALILKYARNVETYPAIEDFRERLRSGSLAKPKSDTDKARQEIFKALLGYSDKVQVSEYLDQISVKYARHELKIRDLATDLRAIDPLLDFNDKNFLEVAAPMWRRAAALRLDG